MIKLYVAYKTLPNTLRKMELATPAKLRLELTDVRDVGTLYQDKECNIYTIVELQGRTVQFTDGTSLKVS
jgi:hypothetical protein